LKRWHFLAGLAGLLFVRALFYWQIGPAVNWTPQLDLGVVALAFRGNVLITTLLFSILSFTSTLVIFYFWLITLDILNGRPAEPDPFQKMIQLQLGRIARWPRWVRALTPVLFTTTLWIGVHPLLVFAGVLHPAQSAAHPVEQGLLVGIGIYFTLKNLLPVFLFLHLIATYVYLGGSPLWAFVRATSRKILVPLNRVPLRWGRIDFAPLIGIVLLLLLLHTLPNLILYQLDRRNLTIWPQ
jgi:uncharacterized protein YggT (Ycf19 family)